MRLSVTIPLVPMGRATLEAMAARCKPMWTRSLVGHVHTAY